MRERSASMSELGLCVAALLLVCSARGEGQLAPYGEALVVVDTDLPIPALVGRLRADFYAADGTWYDSRDVALPSPYEWPVSFGIYSDDEVNDRVVMLRLRAYPEGKVRDYRGERYRPRTPYTEPFVAQSVADLCAAPEMST